MLRFTEIISLVQLFRKYCIFINFKYKSLSDTFVVFHYQMKPQTLFFLIDLYLYFSELYLLCIVDVTSKFF